MSIWRLTLMSSDRDEFSVFHGSECCVISLEWEVDKHVVILQLQEDRRINDQ